MKLDRNLYPDGRGKYALLKLRDLDISKLRKIQDIAGNCLEFGSAGSDNEFFVIKLKDIYAHSALSAYADSCRNHDKEFAKEIDGLATSALIHPNKREPD